MTAHTLDEAMERLRKNHYHLCKALKEARENPAVLEEWRRAPSGVCRVEEGEAGRAGRGGYWRIPCASELDCPPARGRC